MVLSWGLVMEEDIVEEGKDVYLRCEVVANPKVYKVGWRHQVEFIEGRRVENRANKDG